MDNYLNDLKEHAREIGVERNTAAQQGVDLIQAKEVGMLEHDEDEDDD
jgi:hypothetical protein